MLTFYDRDGNPLRDLIVAAALGDDPDYATLCQTWIGNYFVSTVWMHGIDYAMGRGTTPVLFETMVFPIVSYEADMRYDLDCRRWCTFDEAINGHQEIVALIMATTDIAPLDEAALNHARISGVQELQTVRA